MTYRKPKIDYELLDFYMRQSLEILLKMKDCLADTAHKIIRDSLDKAIQIKTSMLSNT